jgi:hypothetical protein
LGGGLPGGVVDSSVDRGFVWLEPSGHFDLRLDEAARTTFREREGG